MPKPQIIPPRLPPLLMLRAFEAAARTGSMRKAASDLAVSHTVISRHVRNLEGWMGRKLLLSGPRGAVLTEEGRILMAAVSKAFALVTAASEEIRSVRGATILRIWCIPGLATRWLMPRLATIELLLPNTEIILRSTDAVPDFAKDEADLALGFGEFLGLPDGALPLLRPRMFPIASREWLRRHGTPASAADLVAHPLIHEESHRQWAEWFERAGVQLPQPLRGPRLWDANLGMDAALGGTGVVLSSNILAGQEIAQGKLVELAGPKVQLGGYYLLPAPQLRGSPTMHRMTEWLLAGLKATEFADI